MSSAAARRLSRRHALTVVLVVGGSAVGAALLQACGSTAPAAPAGQPVGEQKPAATTAPAAQAPAQSSAPAKTANGRPDWAVAAEPYKGKKVTILMSAGPWGKSHETMVDEFNKLTGITINYDSLPEEQIPTKLQTSVLSRSGDYDAVVMIWDLLGQYNKAGLLADMTPYYNDPKMPAWDVEEYPSRIVDFIRRDGKLIGVPVSVAAQIMMYRKDLFQEAGLQPPDGKTLTWKQVYEHAKKLTKPGLYGTGHGWKAGGVYNETMNVLPGDKPILDDKKRLSIYRDPRVIETYEAWAQMYKEGLMSKEVLGDNIVAAWAKFQTGQMAMHPLSWPIAIADMEDPNKSKIAGKIGYTATPGATPRIGGWAAAVLSDSKNKEAAYLHLAWLASTDIATKEVLKNGNYDMSYTKTFQNGLEKYKPDIMKRPNGAAEIDGMVASWTGIQTGRMVDPTVPEFAQLGNEMYPSLAKVITGEVPAKDGLEQAIAAGEKILADAGYYK
jgi:ABC-type glycerol-3-phosphate transport system substrate-binding protein